MAMRRPLTMNGSVPGMTSDVKMSREDARKLRDTSRRWRSTVRTPSTVGRMIAKKPPRKTTTAFMFQSSPNHRTTSGTSATRGSALKKFNHGRVRRPRGPARDLHRLDREDDGRARAHDELERRDPHVVPEARLRHLARAR